MTPIADDDRQISFTHGKVDLQSPVFALGMLEGIDAGLDESELDFLVLVEAIPMNSPTASAVRLTVISVSATIGTLRSIRTVSFALS